MDNASLYKKIEMLSDESKTHLNTFIEYLIYKHNKELAAGEREAGFLEGKISITNDFDEPLAEFNEHM
jgi:hypothetical protein